MKGLKLFVWMVVVTSVACSKTEHTPTIQEALKKEHPKNQVALKILKNSDDWQEDGNWFTQDPELDNAEGTSADKAYNNLNLKHQKEIIVAVIDSGVDIHHEDLKNKIWINTDEIPNNKTDDDNNGYIDDIYGWNFIGGHDENGNPTHIEAEQLEVTRELVKMRAKKKKLEEQGLSLSPEDQAYFEKVLKEVTDGLSDANQMIGFLDEAIKSLEKNSDGQDIQRILTVRKIYQDDVDYYYNENFRPREKIVKDDPEDFTDVVYGNNDVNGPGASHGTHVAGIIAADRNNGLGVRGIAQNVKIMVLRVVPNGDERDKDVALAVKYAADNGAHIINMSFGKAYSPQKDLVGKAFQYAENKGLLIFHAAGNESTDRDIEDRYPTRKVYNTKGEVTDTIGTWFDVGASSQYKNMALTATFTNYGQTTVDLFAPGVRLSSTVPNNQYAIYSGTSMACPAAAGVAALVWSQMPDLHATEMKTRLMETVRSRAGLSVRLPSNHIVRVPFETLSITGGIVDAYNALTSLMSYAEE